MSGTPLPGGAKSILFVSHDGVLGGPGRSQVIPYLRGYREAGWSVRLLSYEKPDLLADGARRARVSGELEEAGVRWTVLPYRRAMVRDLLAGLRAVWRAVEEDRPSVLHARSYVPALLCDLAGRRYGAKLLFDMRGFWVDEKVDGGLWTRGSPMFRLWKRIERRLLRRADAIVVLAKAGADILRSEGLVPETTPVEVIYCGADLERFRPHPPEDAPEPLRPFLGKRIYTFLGATGTWYLLPEMLDFAAGAVREDPDARILFLTEDPGGEIRRGLESRGIPPDRYLLRRVPHEEVPRWISPSHAGVFFIRSCRSKKASCPTKLGEFLACGVPVIVNEGIGDTADLVRGGRVGVMVAGFDSRSCGKARGDLAALRIEPRIAEQCVLEARGRLDASAGSRAFARLAERLVLS